MTSQTELVLTGYSAGGPYKGLHKISKIYHSYLQVWRWTGGGEYFQTFFFYRWTVKTRLTFFSTDGQSWDRTNIFSTDGQTRDRTKTDCLKQAAHGLPCVHARLDHAQNACSPKMHLSPYSISTIFVSGHPFIEQWKVGTEKNSGRKAHLYI